MKNIQELKREKLLIQVHKINSERHKIIESIQSKSGRKDSREEELFSLKRKREKIFRELKGLRQ